MRCSRAMASSPRTQSSPPCARTTALHSSAPPQARSQPGWAAGRGRLALWGGSLRRAVLTTLAAEQCRSRRQLGGHPSLGNIPIAETMAMFAQKHTARELAESAEVPVLAGSPLLVSADEALDYARRIGLPVLLKATGGWGAGASTGLLGGERPGWLCLEARHMKLGGHARKAAFPAPSAELGMSPLPQVAAVASASTSAAPRRRWNPISPQHPARAQQRLATPACLWRSEQGGNMAKHVATVAMQQGSMQQSAVASLHTTTYAGWDSLPTLFSEITADLQVCAACAAH